MGADTYPNPRFSFTNLFEPSHAPYCSDSMAGPAIVQGVYIPDDTDNYWKDDPRIKDSIDTKLKNMKVRDREDEMFTIHKDEQRAKLLVGAGYYLKRAIHDDPITYQSIQHYPLFYLSQAFDSSTKIAKRNFPNASSQELRV